MTDVEEVLALEREQATVARVKRCADVNRHPDCRGEHEIIMTGAHPSMGRCWQCRLCICYQWEFPMYPEQP